MGDCLKLSLKPLISDNEANIGIAVATLNSNSSLLSDTHGHCSGVDCVGGLCGQGSHCACDSML